MIVALIGAAGAGKSALLQALADCLSACVCFPTDLSTGGDRPIVCEVGTREELELLPDDARRIVVTGNAPHELDQAICDLRLSVMPEQADELAGLIVNWLTGI